MSEQPKTRPKVPEGKARFVTTRQKEPNEKGFVGYETTWEPFQKEIKYTTPKKP
jgi:hypothetical protein